MCNVIARSSAEAERRSNPVKYNYYFYIAYMSFMKPSRKIIVAITGASGSIYAKTLLRTLAGLKDPPAEIAVVFSGNAKAIWEYETGTKFRAKAPSKEFDNNNFFVPFASGSSDYDTMIICPASMGVTGRIANGTSEDLIARAADVMLKERRRLILVPRETPYNLIHIKNMETLTLAGAIICPATPSFYSRPSTINDLVMTVVERIISLAGFRADTFRWMEND
jgi:4-hydroxy-3-polyprenylbenzoate decarboxylase